MGIQSTSHVNIAVKVTFMGAVVGHASFSAAFELVLQINVNRSVNCLLTQ